MPESLRATEAGEAWLGNFDDDEVAVAAALLASVEVVSRSQFARELTRVLDRHVATLSGPVALFRVRSLSRQARAAFLGAPAQRDQPLENQEGNAALVEPSRLATNPETFGLPELSGSALEVAHVVDRWVRRYKDRVYVDPSIVEMRERRVRHIVLVSDIASSGKELGDFAAFLSRNPTIRSWISYGLVEVSFAVHSVVESSLNLLLTSGVVGYHRLAPTLESMDWSREDRQAVTELCMKYSDKQKYGLGWGDVGLTSIYEHSVGNGLPMILWQEQSDGRPWTPLVGPDRRVGLSPNVLRVSSSYRPSRSVSRYLANLRQGTTRALRGPSRAVAYAETHLQHSPNELALILLMSCVASGKTSREQIMDAARMSFDRLNTIARLAHDLGLVDGYVEHLLRRSAEAQRSGLVLTSTGRRVLQRYARKPAAPVDGAGYPRGSEVVSRDDFYYPHKLR